jgi:hypothetical protein
MDAAQAWQVHTIALRDYAPVRAQADWRKIQCLP